MVLMLAFCGDSFAKCVDRLYEVSGVVWIEPHVPAAGASVAVAWIARGKIEGPAIAVADPEGHFTVRFRFNAYSGSSWLRGDLCAAKLNELSLSAYSSTARSDTIRIPIGGDTSIKIDPVPLVYRLEAPQSRGSE